jgi:hypothetical protein
VAAELQTCDPADVPRSREGIREYFEYMRPKLAGSEAAQRAMDHLLNAKVMMPAVPTALRPVNWVVNEVHRRATIATMPHWMRKLAGLRQSGVTDTLLTPVMKIAFRLGASNPRLMLATLKLLSPGTVPIAAPVLLGIPPVNPVTMTPAQARERYGVLPPRDEYARFRAHVDSLTATKRAQVVGPQIDESVAILGAVA